MITYPWGLRIPETRKKKNRSNSLAVLGSLIGDVASSLLLGYIIDLACMSWANPDTESGNCWFYDTHKMHVWFHLVPLLALTVAVFGYFSAWRIEKRKEDAIMPGIKT